MAAGTGSIVQDGAALQRVRSLASSAADRGRIDPETFAVLACRNLVGRIPMRGLTQEPVDEPVEVSLGGVLEGLDDRGHGPAGLAAAGRLAVAKIATKILAGPGADAAHRV